ncbi:unnamed protein product [Cyprideis torosa]|uniref:Uncharacterized protein n=1 Tax=Cyprideis torosa TaxID=163714 RepID=A0A7R8WLW8_9CRUS|nr:unnamed protein product [Cyprideis torosa]CAG0904717.1 unnamed protein product [Cyprideis torosa]
MESITRDVMGDAVATTPSLGSDFIDTVQSTVVKSSEGGCSSKWVTLGVTVTASIAAMGFAYYYLSRNDKKLELCDDTIADTVSAESRARKFSRGGQEVGILHYASDDPTTSTTVVQQSPRNDACLRRSPEEQRERNKQATMPRTRPGTHRSRSEGKVGQHTRRGIKGREPCLTHQVPVAIGPPEELEQSRMSDEETEMFSDDEDVDVTAFRDANIAARAGGSNMASIDEDFLNKSYTAETAIELNGNQFPDDLALSMADTLPREMLPASSCSDTHTSIMASNSSSDSDKDEQKHIGWIGIPVLANIPGLHEYVTKLKLAFQSSAIDEETLLLLKQLFFQDTEDRSPFAHVPCARRFENILDLLHMRLKTRSGQSIISLLFGSTINFTVVCDTCETASVITYRRLIWKVPLSSVDFLLTSDKIKEVLHHHHAQAAFPPEAFKCQHQDTMNYVNTNILTLPCVLVLQFYPQKGKGGWPKKLQFGLRKPQLELDMSGLTGEGESFYKLISACCCQNDGSGVLVHRQYYRNVRSGQWYLHRLGDTVPLPGTVTPVDNADFMPHILIYVRSDFVLGSGNRCYYYRLSFDLCLDQEALNRGASPLQQDWPPELWTADPATVGSAAQLAPLHFFTSPDPQHSISYAVLCCLLHTPGLKDCYLDVPQEHMETHTEQTFRALFHQLNITGEFDATRFLQLLNTSAGERTDGIAGSSLTPFHFTSDVLSAIMRFGSSAFALCNFLFHLHTRVRRICAVCYQETKQQREDDLYVIPFKIPEELNPCGIQQILPLNFWSKNVKTKTHCYGHRYYWKVLDTIEKAPRILILGLKQVSPHMRKKQIFLDFQINLKDYCFDSTLPSTEYLLYAVCSQMPGQNSYAALVRDPSETEPSWKRYQSGCVSTIKEPHKIMSICNVDRALLFYVNKTFSEPFEDPQFGSLYSKFIRIED